MRYNILLGLLKGDANRELLEIIDYLQAENRVLKAQLNATGKRLHLSNEQRQNLALLGKRLGNKLPEIVSIVKPATLLKWYRFYVTRKYDGSKAKKAQAGRPPVPPDVVELVLRLTRDNRAWGYDRIVGALKALGHDISDQTVGNLLKAHDLEPAPERKKRTTWREFLSRHKAVIWATDFLTQEVLTWHGVVTYYILIFINLKSRQVVLGGITAHPTGEWMAQVARNLTGFDGELVEASARYLIRDRDSKFTAKFDAILASVGIKAVKLPPRSPNLNAFAERFVRSLKEDCLDQLILLSEGALRRAVREYLGHYHAERPHQGQDIGNELLFADERAKPDRTGKVNKSERLGGLLNFYWRDAA